MVRDRCVAFSKSLTSSVGTILLIEDNLAEARLLQELLKGSTLHQAELVQVSRLAMGIAACEDRSVDVILLDLTLPDSYGLASLDVLIEKAPSAPIVVLTNTQDDDLAVEAVRRGAQDYLVKRQINQDLLVRAIRYAIERQQGEEALREINETLELRVQQRTIQLESANQRLLREVQERQNIQERLTLAQQAAKIGTFEWKLTTDEVIWSPELEALYGVAAGGFDGDYEAWIKTIHIEDRPLIEQALRQAVEQRRPLDTEFRILRGLDEVRWVAVKSNVFYDTNGAPLRMIGIHMDITEKKQMEAQFLRAQRLESLGTLASGIAHDLNNILTPILGVAQLLPLKFPDLDESNRHLIETLETSARRGASLIKQILSFARGVEGKRISLQLSHVLREVRQILGQTLPKSIEICLDADPHLRTVIGDVTQLHQVFMNLCVNARDAMPQGGCLSIQAENVQIEEAQARSLLEAQPGTYVKVSITDTGYGISPETLPRIFDPFFTTKAVGKGTGLGLSAVLGIVKSHGGFIDVRSDVGNGSTFTVYLPATQTNAPVNETDLDPLVGHRETLLIVDDETAIREILRITLETYHYRVLTAENGTAAVSLYREHQADIDLVLIDLMMPDMDGPTALALMQQIHPDVAAIAMSGLSSTQAISDAYDLGFQSFLVKPILTRELLRHLRACLDDRPPADTSGSP